MGKAAVIDLQSLTSVVKKPTADVSISRVQGTVASWGNQHLLHDVWVNRHHLQDELIDRRSFQCQFFLLNHSQLL